MPARKHRPGKYGTTPTTTSTTNYRDMWASFNNDTKTFINKVMVWERASPGDLHYVGWPEMHLAEALAKRGLLTEGNATGCFHVTDHLRALYAYKTQHPQPWNA